MSGIGLRDALGNTGETPTPLPSLSPQGDPGPPGRCPAAPDSFPSALSFFDSHWPRSEPLGCTMVKEARAGGPGDLVSPPDRAHPWPQASRCPRGAGNAPSLWVPSWWNHRVPLALPTGGVAPPCHWAPTDASLPGPDQGSLSWDRGRGEMPLGPAIL